MINVETDDLKEFPRVFYVTQRSGTELSVPMPLFVPRDEKFILWEDLDKVRRFANDDAIVAIYSIVGFKRVERIITEDLKDV